MTTSDHRHFLDWDAPALPRAAAFLADRYAAGETLDLSPALIAVPGGRAGRRLKEILVDLAHQRRLRLIPPRITTVGALPELLYTPAMPIAEDTASHRAWASALRTLDHRGRRELFPHAPADTDLRGWIALGRQLHALQHEVGAAGLPFADVAELCGESLLFDDSDRWTILARAQQVYLAGIARLGRADRDHARRAALDSRAVQLDGDLWLIGLAELPIITRRMVDALVRNGGRVDILVHAPADRAAAFDALGCVIPSAWIGEAIPLRDDQISIVEHPSNQATAAVAAIHAFREPLAADEIVLGVPDEEVIPYLEQRIAEADAHARYAGGTPVARTSVYRLLAAIADLLTDASFEALAALARHPVIGEWLRANRWGIEHTGAARFQEHDTWLAELDAFACERQPARVTDGLTGSGGRGRHVVEALVAALRSDRLLGALRGERPLNEWMPLILELLIELYGRTPLNRDIPDERRLIDTCRKIRDAAAAHTRVPAAGTEVCDAGSAIRILLDDTSGDAVPAEAGDAAIELLGWLELHLDDAPAVVLTGMNEPFVPQAVNAHPFLPNSLRTRAGIEDNDRRYARDAYQLTAMLHSRRHIHLTAGRRTVLGDPLRPSRLLLATSGVPLARRVERFLNTGEQNVDAVTDGVTVEPAAAGAVSRFNLPPEPEIQLAEVPTVLNVTDFAALLADPYAFALDRVLGRDVDDDSARELDALRFGSLTHRVLELFAQTNAATSSSEAEVAAALDHLLDSYVADRFGASTSTAVRLQVEQLRIRLRAFARWQAGWVAAGWVTRGVECRVDDAGVPFETDAGTIRIRGRIDRIDYNERTGEWAVFDYKTGERADPPEEKHRKKSGEWIDLQLPLYRDLLPHVHDADGNPIFTNHAATVHLGYILLCGDPDRIGCAIAEWSDDDLASARAALRTVIAILKFNIYTFEDRVDRFASQDLKALLGHGRLILEEDELEPFAEESA